jgi:hypothetical protein
MEHIVPLASLLCGAALILAILRFFSRPKEPQAFPPNSELWVVTCPRTHCPAVLEISHSRQGLDCEECSLWPQNLDCSRDCLGQVAAAEEHHLSHH